MERNDTFGHLKSAIEEALEFEFDQESFLLLWNDMELNDNDTPDKLGMKCIALGKPFKLLIV